MRFHCTGDARKASSKASHDVIGECPRLKQVLRANPEYGDVVPGTRGLRKMRVRVQGFRGNRGGYRTIYSKHDTDEGVHVVFHFLFFKGDAADLHQDKYAELSREAERIAANLAAVAWEE